MQIVTSPGRTWTFTVDMSASAINANNSFMPDTLIEWLILVVLIFIGIKLFRKMSESGHAGAHAH